MENIESKVTSTGNNDRFIKLIDGTDYYWDNDKEEMIININGLTKNHSDIICSNDGDSCVIKRVWFKDKEIDANTLWCSKSKKSLATIVENEFSWWDAKNNEYRITKSYEDGIVNCYIEKYSDGTQIESDITRVAIGIVHKTDKDKIIEESFLNSEIDDDIRQAYLNLETEEEKKTFIENWFKLKTSASVVDTVKVEEDRIIKASDIDTDVAVGIMRATSGDTNDSSNTEENFKKLRDKLKKQVQNEYIVKRGRTSNGQLDRLLTIKEMKEIDEQVNRLIENDKKLQVSADMSKINGVYDAINNKNLDSQIAYEVKKETYCNNFGYTPESFDAYMNEIFRLQGEKLDKGEYAKPISTIGGDGFEETTTIASMLDNADVEREARAKLVRVEGWDELEEDQKPILYRSKLLLAVIEEDKREMDPAVLKKLREEDPNGMRLYDLMNDTIYSVERWQKVRQKRKGDKSDVVHHKRSVAAKTDVEKFMEERKAARDEKKASGELINKTKASDQLTTNGAKRKDAVNDAPPKNIDDIYNDIMDDTFEIIGDDLNDTRISGNTGGRESGQFGSSVIRPGLDTIHGETSSSSEDVATQSGNNESGWNERGAIDGNKSRDNESAQNGNRESGKTRSGAHVEYEVLLDDYNDIEIIEIGDESNGEYERSGNTDTTRIDGDVISSDNRNIQEYSGESNRIGVNQTEHNVDERYNVRGTDQDSMAGDWNGVVGSNESYNNSGTGTIEVIEYDRPNTVRDSGSSDSETQHGDRSSEIQGDIDYEEPESQEEIIEVISPENRISEESIDTIGRRVYSENTTVLSNIKINEVNENEFRENNRYNITSNNDNTSSDDTDTDTSSDYIRSKRGNTNIQSEEVSKEINIKQNSERQSSEQLPSGNREIKMAERTEIKMLNITNDGNIILTNGKIVTPEEFKQMKEEGSLTVEEMLQDDEPKEVTPNRVRITDDNLVNMFKLITTKKAIWNQKDDMAIISIENDSTEYVYEPVSSFINKYTEFAINNATVSTTPAPKIKDVEVIKENVDVIKEKVHKNQKIKDKLEEYKKAKEANTTVESLEVEEDTVKVIDITADDDAVVVNYDDDKFKEYDRPLEAKVVKLPDNYFLNRHHDLNGKLDSISGVTVTEGNIELLRRNINSYIKVKDFRDSATYSRDIYLPNSNYVVKVRRLKNRNDLTWMFQFLEGIKDAKLADDIARPDILHTVFKQLDFPFDTPVSEDDFLKNLHQTDVTILMAMFALVNLPEDKDGRVIIPNISKFNCKKCGKSAFLKQPMSIDIKEEFFAIYPESLWQENYLTYRQTKYESITKAYRASKVGARYKLTDSTSDEPFKTDIIISRPTVYKSNMVENFRLDVVYQLRLEELTGMLTRPAVEGNVPDEVLKAIDYMSDRTFSEVRNRVLVLDDIDLSKDPEEIPESSRDQYKEFQEESRIIQFVMSEIQNTDTKLANVFNSCQYIDAILFVDKETSKPVHIIDHSNLYDMIDSIQYLSDATVNAMNKKIEELRNGYNGISTNIVFTPEEFKGKFRWDDVYQVINGKVMSEKEFLQHIQQEGGYSDSDMKEVAELRQKYKANLEEGKCVCGNDESWVLNWTDLLFFSTAKTLGKTISIEPDRSYLL